MKTSKPRDLAAETGAALRGATVALAKAIAGVGSLSETSAPTALLELTIVLFGDALIAHHNAIEACKKGLAK